MTKTVLNLIMTFDGFIAGAHDEVDWIDKVQKRNPLETFGFDAFLLQVGAIIMGRRSYDFCVKHQVFEKNTYGPSPVFVLSHNVPSDPPKGTDLRFVTADIKEAHRQASDAAKDKWIYLFGGADVVRQCFDEDLIDELWITIAPILIGRGIRLFDHLKQRHIELETISITGHDSGMIETRFRVMKKAG